ncbi:MAG: antA/AntB antirepressor family protein [Acidithiobacillus sp.]
MRNIPSVLPVSHQMFPGHEQTVPTINSHVLHRYLAISENHSNWINYRLKQLLLVENQDILIIRKTLASKAILDAYLIPDAVIRVLQYERATALAYGNTREHRAQNGNNVIDEKTFIARKKQKQVRAAHCDAALEYLASMGPADDSPADGKSPADKAPLSPKDQRSGLALAESALAEERISTGACGSQAQIELAEMRESPKASFEAPVPSQSLVQVTERSIGGRMQPTVDARELHAFLGVGKDFSTWIKDRIGQYDFVENQDFAIDSPISGNQNGRGGDRRSKEYHLSLDMAKELSMVERTPKGKKARQYFIECERRLWTSESPKITPSSASPCRPQDPAVSLPVIDADTVQSVQSVIPVLQLHREYLRNFREMGLEPREALDAVTAAMERQGIRIRAIIHLPNAG